MKIAAVLDSRIDSGGGFNQALNAILQMHNLAKGVFDFSVTTSIRENIDYLNQFDIKADYVKPSLKDTWLGFCALSPVGRRIQNKMKMIGTLECHLLQQHVDLVYFLSPSTYALSLQRLNYIITVWDLCHRDTPEFPESREFNQFLARERTYHHCLAQALAVLADSEVLADRIVTCYGVDRDRIIAMPFSPSPFLRDEKKRHENILGKYQLKGGYLFYPAQFWAHKNHIRILEALLILREKGLAYQVVFCGSDHGNVSYIKQFIQNNGLVEQVKVLGFVNMEDLHGLYIHSRAVVMPTYFGPTNIPPLEAWELGKPLIYSSHLKEQVGDAAICIDPDCAEDLAGAMQLIIESDQCCDELIANGITKLNEINTARNHAVEILQAVLLRFEKRRRCWA